MARDPFYDLVSKMGKGRRNAMANAAAGRPVIPPSAPGNPAMADPMQMMSVNGRPDLMKPALPNGIGMSDPTPNPFIKPGASPGTNPYFPSMTVDPMSNPTPNPMLKPGATPGSNPYFPSAVADPGPNNRVYENPELNALVQQQNAAMGPGGRPGVNKMMMGRSDMSGGLGGQADGPGSTGGMSMADGGMVTGGGFGTGPNGNPTYNGDWGGTVFGYDPSAGMPPKNQDRVPSIDNGYAVGPFGPQQTQISETTVPRGPSFPSLPPVEPLGPIGYAPNSPAQNPFASLFGGGSIPTPQSKPSRFDDAMNSFAPTLQPTLGQIMQGPAGVFGKPTRFGPNPPAPPAPKPSPWPTPQANPMRGIGGPDLMMAGPQGGVSPDRMGEYGEFGTDPFGYGGLTGQMGDGTSAGVMGGGFANAGYGSPSYGVNPVTAGHDFAAAQQEGFSYGGYNPSDPTGAGATGGGSSKVVCTAMNEAYGFGGFRQAIWLAYSAKHMRPEHERGYHAIFVPLLAYARGGVSLPRQAMWLSLAHIARHRTADIRAEMRGGKRDRLGRMYRAVLEPLCYVVGKVLG